MLADDVNGSRGIGNPAANGLPGFTVVGCRENIDAVIVAAMPVEGGEGRALCGLRCRNTAHIGAFRHAGNFRHDVLPSLPAVARHLEVAVIGANPQHIGGERRFTDGGDGRIFLDAVVPRQGVFVRHFSENGQFAAVRSGGQVAAQARPAVSAIGRLEEIVSAVIDGRVVVRGDGHTTVYYGGNY